MEWRDRRESNNIVDRRGERIPWFAGDIDIMQAIEDLIGDLRYGTRHNRIDLQPPKYEYERMEGSHPVPANPIPDEVIERIIREGR